jgi:diaminohydroxyphosphoribosylaminopyrimidine deaminase/5-amino-6-(5-phosphoribosylamino)uracil reductase
LVKENQVLGEGFHLKAGQGHAEVNALADAKQRGNDVKGATAYVTLEPCSHFGRTPPCSQGLIDAGVARVVGAMTDPNPQVAGRGFNMLRDAGIEVEQACLAEEAAKLNPGFIKRMTTGMPLVRIKMATSLDGRTAMQNGDSQWITGPEARADVQKLRARSCAIITGADSVLIDNPSMNVRDVEDYPLAEKRQPLRVVIDGRNRVNAKAKLFTLAGPILMAACSEPEQRVQRSSIMGEPQQDKLDGLDYWLSPSSSAQADKVDLKALLAHLASLGHNEVLVESGAQLAGAFIEQGLADELVLYTAPTLLGSDARPAFTLPFEQMNQQLRWAWSDVRMVGNDLRLILTPES